MTLVTIPVKPHMSPHLPITIPKAHVHQATMMTTMSIIPSGQMTEKNAEQHTLLTAARQRDKMLAIAYLHVGFVVYSPCVHVVHTIDRSRHRAAVY